MRNCVMFLNRTTSLDVDRYTYCLSPLGRPPFRLLRAMDKNIVALFRVDHAKLTNFPSIVARNMEQSTVPDLATHFGVKRRPIENDVYFLRFLAGQNRFDNRFRLKKIVPEKFRRRAS